MHLEWLIEFRSLKPAAEHQDMGLDFCKKEMQKTQNQKKMKNFCEVRLLYIAVSGMEELGEEKN